MKSKGFTMIEVLIVIAILGIMSVMAMGLYTRSLSRGRDVKRIEDMKEVQKGFEMFLVKSDNQSYGSPCNVMFNDSTIFQKGAPEAPESGLAYDGECNLDNYFYCASLENPGDYGNAEYDGTNPPTFVEKSDTDISHFCITNLQ